jgi:serine/threonine-protein kinase
MSPEQTRSSAVDARSDIWALGVILYELLTGTLPFEGEAIGLVVGRILTATPPSPRERCPEIPPDVEAAIQRCLRRAPEERFPTVAALAEALAPFATSRSTRRAPVEPMFQPRASPPPGNTPIALASAASTGTRRSPITGRVARVALALGLACALVAAGARWLRPLAASPPTVVAPGPSPPAASTLPSAGDAATTSPSASAAETHAGPRPSPLPRPAAAHPSASSPRCADLLERLGLGDELGPDERAFFDQECKR